MKRRIDAHTEILPPVLLYRENIEEIVEALQEVSSDIKMSSDTHHFVNLKEWLEVKTDYFSHLEFRTHDPAIFVEFKKMR